MLAGNRPSDGGALLLTPSERKELITKEPQAAKYIKRFMMGYEFINNVERYCLWLVGITPAELKNMPNVLQRVKLCKELRQNSPDKGRHRLADTPSLFREQLNPDFAVVIPKVSAGGRKYIPIGYLSKEFIAGDKLFIIPNATIYHFGIIISNVHMAWQNVVCSKYGPSYSYSNTLAYNTFPWPEATNEQKAAIEKTAQAILDARAIYPDSSLADLYDETTMPLELRRAHQANDRAVMQAYGFDTKTMNEEKCVAELMKMYQKLSNQ